MQSFLLDPEVSQRKKALLDTLTREVEEDSPQYATFLDRYFGLSRAQRKENLSIIEFVYQGIPTTSAKKLAEHMGVTYEVLLINFVGLSDSTYRRRVKAKAERLTQDESDKLVRYAHLLQLATGLMEGDEALARHWLNSPVDALNNQTPYAMATTEAGARRVKDLLVSLEYGMFS